MLLLSAHHRQLMITSALFAAQLIKSSSTACPLATVRASWTVATDVTQVLCNSGQQHPAAMLSLSLPKERIIGSYHFTLGTYMHLANIAMLAPILWTIQFLHNRQTRYLRIQCIYKVSLRGNKPLWKSLNFQNSSILLVVPTVSSETCKSQV